MSKTEQICQDHEGTIEFIVILPSVNVVKLGVELTILVCIESNILEVLHYSILNKYFTLNCKQCNIFYKTTHLMVIIL